MWLRLLATALVRGREAHASEQKQRKQNIRKVSVMEGSVMVDRVRFGEMQVVTFAVVSGYCEAWREICEKKERSEPQWFGVKDRIEVLGLHSDPSHEHLGWSVAAALAIHNAEFEGVFDEFSAAFQVGFEAVRLTRFGQGAAHV